MSEIPYAVIVQTISLIGVAIGVYATIKAALAVMRANQQNLKEILTELKARTEKLDDKLHLHVENFTIHGGRRASDKVVD